MYLNIKANPYLVICIVISHVLGSRTPDWEGQLSYKAPKSSATFSMQQQQYKVKNIYLNSGIMIRHIIQYTLRIRIL